MPVAAGAVVKALNLTQTLELLAAIYEWKPFVHSGGVVPYGADAPDIYRRTANFVDKIPEGRERG
jgi:hypothetical protein